VLECWNAKTERKERLPVITELYEGQLHTTAKPQQFRLKQRMSTGVLEFTNRQLKTEKRERESEYVRVL